MLRTLKTEKADKALRTAAYVLMAVCAAAFLLTEVRYGFKAKLLDVLPYPVWLVSLCWLVRGDMRRPVYWLGLAFVAWFGMTRLLQGGAWDRLPFYLFAEVSIIYAFVFPFARATGDLRRLRVLDVLMAVFVLVMTLASLVGLWAVVHDQSLTLPDGRYPTGLGDGARLEILGISSNGCGLLMAMAILSTVYLLLRYWRLWRLIPALAVMIPNYLALAATDSRMAELSLVAAVLPAGAVVGAAALKRTFRGRRVAVAAIALAAALLCYVGLGAGVNILNGLRVEENTTVTETASVETESTEAEGAEAEIPMLEARDKFDGYTSGRTDVYLSCLRYLNDHPAVLGYGADSIATRRMTSYGMEEAYYHMKIHLHNSFLQTLATTGLPGLALILAICVLLLICSLRLLFSPRRSAAEKLLPVMLLLLILDSLAESPLFVPYDQISNAFFNLFFFLCAGYVVELGSRDVDV